MKGDKLNNGKLREWTFIVSMLFFPAVLFLIFYVYVNLNSIVMAFQNIAYDGAKTFAGVGNFLAFFKEFGKQDSIVVRSILNSLKMYFINLIICIPLYISFSYYFFRKWAATGVFRLIVMLPSIISSFVICLLFKKFVEVALPGMLKSLFDIQNFPNLITSEKYTFGTTLFYMIWISFATSLIVYSNAMKEIDEQIFEAARLDGANVFQELFLIVLPMIYPTLTTFLVLGVAGIFTNNGPVVAFYEYTAPAEVYNLGYYITQRTMRVGQTEYPLLAAIGILITLIMAPVTIGVKTLLEKVSPAGD